MQLRIFPLVLDPEVALVFIFTLFNFFFFNFGIEYVKMTIIGEKPTAYDVRRMRTTKKTSDLTSVIKLYKQASSVFLKYFYGGTISGYIGVYINVVVLKNTPIIFFLFGLDTH